MCDTCKRGADLRVSGSGTIYLLHPASDAGQAWMDEHIPEDAMYLGKAVAVEHRYIGDIVQGAIADGLAVE